MRNNQSVEENTKFLAKMTEHSSNENHQVKHIAEATQKDSEAMKTIAMMTMLYLPASFVAVCLKIPTPDTAGNDQR
jgi:Mg2+ and Co2+ transporter CorA